MLYAGISGRHASARKAPIGWNMSSGGVDKALQYYKDGAVWINIKQEKACQWD